jgi:hypothetical protein
MPDLTKPKSRNDFTSLLFVNTMKNAANPGVLHFMMLTKSGLAPENNARRAAGAGI